MTERFGVRGRPDAAQPLPRTAALLIIIEANFNERFGADYVDIYKLQSNWSPT
jgi:hypothetical protein